MPQENQTLTENQTSSVMKDYTDNKENNYGDVHTIIRTAADMISIGAYEWPDLYHHDHAWRAGVAAGGTGLVSIFLNTRNNDNEVITNNFGNIMQTAVHVAGAGLSLLGRFQDNASHSDTGLGVTAVALFAELGLAIYSSRMTAEKQPAQNKLTQ